MLCVSIPRGFLTHLAPHRSPLAARLADAEIGNNRGAFFSILFTHDAQQRNPHIGISGMWELRC